MIATSLKAVVFWSGEIAVLICLDAEYMCFTNGIRLINHSPSKKTVEPNHDEANMPTKKMKSSDVINPRPVETIHVGNTDSVMSL
uniref:Uncharacterized protein n=1 Tax=Rhizophora mucronata TaxID=61149 RepID=A0A2P2M5L9_RHIMU